MNIRESFSLPSAGVLEPAIDTDDAEWHVRGELIRNLINAARGTQLLSVMLMCAIVVLGWGRFPDWQLLGWLGLGVGLAGCRIGVECLYDRHIDKDAAWQKRFIDRYSAVWMASGIVWGLAVLIFFGRSPVPSQFICWLIVAGVGAYAVNCLALHPPLVRRYLFALSVTLLGSISFRIYQQELDGPSYLYGFLLLSLGQWLLLLRVGSHIYETHRNNYELLRHNHVLINSLTQQRQAALSAVATKNRLLASAAHDMRQPVLALSLYADWLRNEPEAVHEIAPKIVRATHAVNALFESLFDLARFDSDQIRLHIEKIDLKLLLRDLELQHRPAAEAKGLEFRVHGISGEVLTDSIQVRRMIGNLLGNAIKYTETGGILLAARRTQNDVRIEVWDTGIGIAPEHLRDVFLEFYKVPDHAGTSDGFGLGLSIVARLSHALGHAVTVRSRRHRGSVFGVNFRSVAATGAVNTAPESIKPTKRLHTSPAAIG
jgi:signal transduction histidine kinase